MVTSYWYWYISVNRRIRRFFSLLEKNIDGVTKHRANRVEGLFLWTVEDSRCMLTVMLHSHGKLVVSDYLAHCDSFVKFLRMTRFCAGTLPEYWRGPLMNHRDE